MGARPAQEIPDRDKILEKLKGLPPVSEESRAAAITRRIALPPRFPTIEAEILAHERGDKIWDQLLQWLYSQQVPATILDSQGHQYVLPMNVWAAVDARLILHTGKKRLGSKSGDVLLSREHLEAAIEKEEVAKGGNSVAGQDTAPAEIDRSPPKRGRRPKYDWQSFDAQVVAIAHYDGLPDLQAELEKKMLQWCEDHWGSQPGLSTVRGRLGPLCRKLLEEDYISEP